ncbi:substrate-binding domain-containing protein [bacterium]|nr:substrate-binding domain-containing protein [bacterium]
MKKTILLFLTLSLVGGSQAAAQSLGVYGTPGAYGPINECAQIFAEENGVQVQVTSAARGEWMKEALDKADLVYEAAEYTMDGFIQKNPDFIDTRYRYSLGVRPSGILVRPTNPKKIRKFADLYNPGIKILVVAGGGQTGIWEDMAARKGDISTLRKNITAIAADENEATRLWRESKEFDAWITWESWHYRLKSITDLVPVAENLRVYRSTPIAITSRSMNKELSFKFVTFMQSERAQEVFQQWGWK